MARKMRMLRDHGQSKKYYHDIEGYNGRLDSLQAGLLHVKLRHLAEWNEQRQAAAAEYKKLLASNTAVICRTFPKWSRPVYHLFVVRVPIGKAPKRLADEDRHRHPLPDSAAPAERVPAAGLQGRRLPGRRKAGARNSLAADVPAAREDAAGPRR